jgi:hypothetical protein
LRDCRYFDNEDNKLYTFFYILFLFGLLLANGSKYFIGELYEIVYNTVPIFWIFREPWAKFTPIMIFASSILLCGTMSYFSKKINNKYIYKLISILITSCIVLNAFPFFTGEIIWDKWNGTVRPARVEVPNYWEDLTTYIQKSKIDENRIITFPLSFGYMGFNWQNGFFCSNNPASMLLPNPVDSYSSMPLRYSNFVINDLYNHLDDPTFNLTNYLSILNIRYVLQENDADWRYSGNFRILPPSESTSVIAESNAEKVAEFGRFTRSYLATIPNEEPDLKLHNELYKELTNKTILDLYKVNDDFYLHQFYTPSRIIIADGDIHLLSKVTSSVNYTIRSAIYLDATEDQMNILKNLNNTYNINIIKKNFGNNKFVTETNISSYNDLRKLENEAGNISPIIEFKKINLIKYRVRIHNATTPFVLVFSENYHRGWKIYPTNYTKEKVRCITPENGYNYNRGSGDQASTEDLCLFTLKRWITSLGEKELNIKNNLITKKNMENSKQEEHYRMAFISKNFQGTIQNDNMPNGPLYETWLEKPIEEDVVHIMANGYANSWIIDPALINKKYYIGTRNFDGSYDFELIIEFGPQRIYYIGACISIITAIAFIGFLLYACYRERHNGV